MGPLTGKTALGVILFLVSWLVLYIPPKKREASLGIALTVSLILIVIVPVPTFPPFFDLLKP